MALQMILRSGCVVIGLLAGLPAVAQNAPPQRASQIAPAAPPLAAVAPALHRQPRAADTPAVTQNNSANSPDRETADDVAMNRIIRGICRGC